MNKSGLTEFATHYAAAWGSQDPDSLASFYGEEGALAINDGAPAVGRAAIAAVAGDFMAAFPDMVVRMESLTLNGRQAVFRWHWTGTNTGPGGTGKRVDLRGYEDWLLGPDGLILLAKGYYDEAEYQRQVGPDA